MTAELPTGDLTFLMTDIVDSTAWWDLDPVNMAEAVRRHEAIVGRTVAAHGGAVARSHGEGDSTLSAFERAADAVMAAVATQHALRSEEWPGAIGLRTRMGLHSGPADLRDGHYYGTTVNETARVRDLAEPAQVLVSSLTAARAARSLPTAYRLRELGPRRLRGVGRGVVVHEVVHEVLEPGDDGRSATVAPRPGAGPAVVGRARELAVAEAAIEHARATGGGLVLVAGEAGIGKTSLCHALTVRARAVGTVVAWGHSSPDDRRPSLWPWRQALRSWADQADPRVVDEARRAGGPTAVRLLLEPQADHGTDGHEPAAAGDRDERDAAFRGATRLLATAAAHEPLVLVLDDLQWADLATLALVEVLLPPEAATGVVLVATMRREARPRAGAAADALDRILALGATTVVELAGLEAGALRRCIHAIEPDPLGDDVIDRIVEQSGGNPLFATELARWAARAGPDSGLPRTITDVIRARVADLPGDGRRLLAAGSVLGRAWTAPEVAELTGLGVPTARRRLDDAVGAGLVVADGRDRRRFAHRLISEVVGQDLADAERTRLHRAALAALVRAGAPDADAADAARHATAVALADPAAVPAAVARLRRAALVADRSLAHDEAAQHLEQALALDDGSLDPRERYQLLMDLGTTYDRDGQVARAQETLGRAAALAQARGWAPELAAAAVARARVRRFDVDVVDDTGAEPLLAAAWDLLPDDDRSTRARVAAERPCRRPATPEDVEETVRWSATAIDLAQRADDQVALSRALRSAFRVALRPGVDFLDLARRALEAAESARDPATIRDARFGLALAQTATGQLDRVDLEGEVSSTYAWAAAWLTGWKALWRGDLDDAEKAVGAQLGMDGRRPSGVALSVGAAQLFWLRRLEHRLGEIAPLVRAQAEGSPGAVQPLLAWGVTCLETGDPAGARAVHDEVRRNGYAMLKPPGTWNRLFELAWSAELAEGLGDADAAARLHELLLPFDGLHTHSSAFYVGPVAHHLGLLEAHLGRADDARAHLTATIELTERIGARPAAQAARTALTRLGLD